MKRLAIIITTIFALTAAASAESDPKKVAAILEGAKVCNTTADPAACMTGFMAALGSELLKEEVAAANITMECDSSVYRYLDNRLKDDEVLTRTFGNWEKWCNDVKVHKEGNTEWVYKYSLEMGDKSGTCEVESKRTKKKFKEQTRRSTPTEWKQRVTDLNLCLNEDVSLIKGAKNSSCTLAFYLQPNPQYPYSSFHLDNNGFKTPSGYTCWMGCSGSSEEKVEWTKKELEKKGYNVWLDIPDGVEISEDKYTAVLDFYLKTRNGKQCKILQN